MGWVLYEMETCKRKEVKLVEYPCHGMKTCLEEEGCKGRSWYRMLTCLEDESVGRNGYRMEAWVEQEGCVGSNEYDVGSCLE